MARLYLVRHGEAAAGFGEHEDPGLSDKGRAQAREAAGALFSLGLRDAISSPLLRCQQTGAPFAELTGRPLVLENAVAEIPTPRDRRADRQVWLRQVMAGDWSEHPDYDPWRRNMIAVLASAKSDLVVFSHFVAINVCVGAATGSDRVVNFSPANGSITVLETAPEGLKFVSFGVEASGTRVL